MSHPPYIEVLFARGDPPYGAIVVRGLTPRSLSELACAVAEADQAGKAIEDVFAAWAQVYE
ncbi:hypothetical protein [Mycobacterium sp. E740]|uniref:hypothetical protein n=1 Tax=Mycobacterium sp. E740 TaxID=1834149 RepID=UPI0007FFBA54|nr:hypothetical protein [Mycobacterium sp. E740]OBI78210.1 hypothetical protein A5663_20865 [Mycobacterium sp. E740]